MTQPPPPTPPASPPVLDLFGPDGPALHAPGRIAAACWMLAAYSLIPVLLIATALSTQLAKVRLAPYFFRCVETGATCAEGLMIIGAMAFFVTADLSAGRLKRWPRWSMATTGILTGILLVAQGIFWLYYFFDRFHSPFRPRPIPEGLLWCSAVAEAALASTFVFGIIFTAQAAAWWRRSSLLSASASILGLGAAYHGFEFLNVVPIPHSGEGFEAAVPWISVCLGLLSAIGSSPYFIVIALHLTRARLRQNSHAIPSV